MVEKSSTTRNFMLLTSNTPLSHSQTIAPAGQPRLQACQGLPMNLADARLAHFQHRSDLLEVQLIVVIQGHHHALAFREALYGLAESAPKSLIDDVAERI